jgi:hypothetical protein
MEALVISFSDLRTDPRVNRQLRFLKERYGVTACGFSDPLIQGVTYIPMRDVHSIARKPREALRLLGQRFEAYYWKREIVKSAIPKLSSITTDVIIANEVDSLPLAKTINGRPKVILDAHEYSPLEFEERLRWRIFFKRYKEYLCSTYIPKVDGMITVSPGIAERYHGEFGVMPVVMTNAPEYEELRPAGRENEDNRIRLVHHGAAIRSRKIELMLQMVRYLDRRFELNLMLVNVDPTYFRMLEKLARDLPNVRLLPTVPMREICSFINKFDIGVYILPAVSFNNLHALPNKFFEFIQARLGLAVGPSREMARIVREHDLGVVADDFTPQAMARALNGLTREKITYYKERSHTVARLFSAERNKEILLQLVGDVLGGKQSHTHADRERAVRTAI